ncbi:MAG: Ppx/GppA phosphatase family protein [Bacillota bacterium]
MKRLGIIDLGSNSVRLVILDVMEGGYFNVFDEWKEVIRLGEDMEKDGFLKPQRVKQTVKTLQMFKKLCDINKVDKIIGVATAAVRRAKNQRSFLDEVFSTTGLQLRVLSSAEEANYVYQGVINSMDIPKGIIVEIGGGSTKIVYYNRRNLLAHETIPYGSITLTEKFAGQGLSNEEQAIKIEEFFKGELAKIEWLQDIDEDAIVIGVGGSFRNLAKISTKLKRYPLDMVHNYRLASEDFISIYDMIKGLELEKKIRIKGMSRGRADVLPGAFAAIKGFLDMTGKSDIAISSSGLREGIIFNTVVPTTQDKPISDVLGYRLSTLIKLYDQDEKHIEQVINLSLQLFKQLRVLHKFPRSYIKILRVAASLHDSGRVIKFYDHQRHSAYIIRNSNLYGISHKDLMMASFVASCHTKENILASQFTRFSTILSEEDLDSIKKLGVILRLAASFDKSHGGVIKSINCDVLGDSVIMKTEIEGDATLEIKDAYSASMEFKKSFKKNLEIL